MKEKKISNKFTFLPGIMLPGTLLPGIMLLAIALFLGGCAATENRPKTLQNQKNINSQGTNPENHNQGNPSQITARISEAEAKSIALSQAGLTAEQVTFTKCNPEWEDGREYYDVEFYTQDRKEYDFEVDSASGEILDYDFEVED